MKTRYWLAAAAVTVIAGTGLINASWLATPPAGQPRLLAHRGVYQRFDHRGVDDTTCTARRIFKPVNGFLENTIPSMTEAFKDGADVVELDIQPTTDHDIAVFHDWTLDCRTDGTGTTRDHTMAELKALDIGHGYTYDGGKTFPFRGKFKGAMPTLAEVLTAFPDKRFLINFKSNDPDEATALDAYLTQHGLGRDGNLSSYGGDRPVARMITLRPEMRAFSRATLKACGYRYMALGWTGYMPKQCRNTTLFLPANMRWLAWGYPNRLQARFAAAGSYIYLLGPQSRNGGIQGVNSPADLNGIPASWHMGVLTDEIDVVGPAFKARFAQKGRP